MTQDVKANSLNWWQGILLILGIMAAIFAVGQLAGVLQRLITYSAASIGTWVAGGVIALAVVRRFVLGYRYTLEGGTLQVDYVYGKRARFMTQALLRQAVMFDTAANVKEKYPGVKVLKAVKEAPAEKQMALCLKEADGPKILVFEPNEEMTAKIREEIAAERK